MALGDNFFSYLPYGNNTAWPNCSIQHIHRDAGHLFPDTPYVLPMTKAVINIPLVDFTEKNGATEVWPSSHLMVDRPEDNQLSLEKRVQSLASVRMLIPAGSLVIRDMRCWHRGMPNKTAQPRPMLALVYFRRFHHEPDNSTIFRYTLPQDNWQALPDISKTSTVLTNLANLIKHIFNIPKSTNDLVALKQTTKWMIKWLLSFHLVSKNGLFRKELGISI